MLQKILLCLVAFVIVVVSGYFWLLGDVHTKENCILIAKPKPSSTDLPFRVRMGHAISADPRYQTAANYISLPSTDANLTFPNNRVWVSSEYLGGCNIALVDGMSRMDRSIAPQDNLLAVNLSNEISKIISNSTKLYDPYSILCQAYEKVKHLKGQAMGAVVSIEMGKLNCAIIGAVGVFVIRQESIIFKIQGNSERYFFPPYLKQNDNLRDVKLATVDLYKGDIVLIASEGVLDNVPEEILADLIYYPDVQLTNKAKNIVNIASQISLGIASTPFSIAAYNEGFFWEGGRPGDASIILAEAYRDPFM